MNVMLSTNTEAPDFTLLDQDGDSVSLSSFKGHNVVLYFYPKANTPGCTVQARGVRDHSHDYSALDAIVLGVSPDPVKAVKKFSDKCSLNFKLLADEDHKVCELYEVWQEKKFMGKKYMGATRSTYIIDREGTIAHVITKASPTSHDDAVIAVLKKLGAESIA
jgi:thioredoxin-dependent peroxiredoxin